MIIEIAEFKVKPEDVTAFGEAITRAAQTTLAQAAGYCGHQILACRETPGRFILSVNWNTLEDHTVGFRESAAFGQWRAIIGPFFLAPPHVEHFDVVG